MKEGGSQGCVLDWSFTFRLCTSYVVAEAPGALIVITWPLGRCTVMPGKSGLARTRFAVPGVSGNIPSVAKTYQADIVPRSSLPGIPPGQIGRASCRERV